MITIIKSPTMSQTSLSPKFYKERENFQYEHISMMEGTSYYAPTTYILIRLIQYDSYYMSESLLRIIQDVLFESD